MTGGTITGNTAGGGHGGGVSVYADSGGTAGFTMTGGTISGNDAGGGDGGGVFVYASGTGNADFTMAGGTISGNIASSGAGGGVYVGDSSNTIFKKSGGVIYGSVKADGTTPEDTDKRNTAASDTFGHAVYTPDKKRNATLGTGDDISTDTATNWDL
jgi:hypothetical protein